MVAAMGVIPLSTKLGELMGPHTFVTSIVVDEAGKAALDPGALHGRSQFEKRFQFVPRKDAIQHGQSCWVVWVAVEADSADQPQRYKGATVSTVVVDPQRQTAYKSLAQQVNQIGRAMQGHLTLDPLNVETKLKLKEQLMALSPQLWERSSEALKQAFAS